MDSSDSKLKTHRMRFIEYLPPATEWMALTADERLLAVGRENGQIEIYKTDTWTMWHVIPGIKSSDIRNILWYEPEFQGINQSERTITSRKSVEGDLRNFGKPTNNMFTYNSTSGKCLPRRLITTGLNGAVIEWDLINLQPRKIVDIGDVGIWDCTLNSNSNLFLACDDGAVRIIELESFTELKRLPPVAAKCLSICCSNTERDVIYAGYADGSIRKHLWSSSSAKAGGASKRVSKMETNKEAKIWTIQEVDDYLISGDSNGDVIVWDKRSGNALKTFSELKGDVLRLCVVNQGVTSVYASGVDSKIVWISQVQLSQKNKKHAASIIGMGKQGGVGIDKDWVYAGNTRGQSHDVRCLIYVQKDNALLSGGVSTDLCLYNLEKNGKFHDNFKLKKTEKHKKKFRHIPPFELSNQISICYPALADSSTTALNNLPKDDIMVFVVRKTFEIELWMYEKLKQPLFLLKFEKHGDFGITSVAVNSQATHIAIADVEHVWVYKINIGVEEVKLDRIQFIGHTKSLSNVIHAKFLSDGKSICTFDNKGNLNFIGISSEGDSWEVTKSIETRQDDVDMFDSDDEDIEYIKALEQNGFHALDSNDTNVSFAKFQNSDCFSFDFTSKLASKLTKPDNKGIHAIFTKLILNNRLLVCYDSNKFLIHDLTTKSLTQFSKTNIKKFPMNYLNRFNRIYGMVELSESKFILYTHFNYILVDITCKLPEHSKIVAPKSSQTGTKAMNWNETWTYHHQKYISSLSKSKASMPVTTTPQKTNSNFKIDSRFKGILYMGKTPDGGFVVVENLWKNLVEKLPEVLKVHRFGQ